jgi:chromosome segregation ATPase
MNELKNIANILPEGLSETAIEEIFNLVDSTINEQVENKISLLETKVNAYLRMKIDQIKDQALSELSEESEVFRNAKLFDSVRTLMSLELNNQDNENALSKITNQNLELQEELDVMIGQINSLLDENNQLQNTVKVLGDKTSITEDTISNLERHNSQLTEKVENLEASKEEAFVSSEKAVIISNAEQEINEERTYDNEFLTDEVMRFMPFSPNK